MVKAYLDQFDYRFEGSVEDHTFETATVSPLQYSNYKGSMLLETLSGDH